MIYKDGLSNNQLEVFFDCRFILHFQTVFSREARKGRNHKHKTVMYTQTKSAQFYTSFTTKITQWILLQESSTKSDSMG